MCALYKHSNILHLISPSSLFDPPVIYEVETSKPCIGVRRLETKTNARALAVGFQTKMYLSVEIIIVLVAVVLSLLYVVGIAIHRNWKSITAFLGSFAKRLNGKEVGKDEKSS